MCRAASAMVCCAALCIAEAGNDSDAPVVATAPWTYLRLRREDYEDADLDQWASRVREQGWEEVYAFFKHEDAGAGPRMAREFLDVGGGAGPG